MQRSQGRRSIPTESTARRFDGNLNAHPASGFEHWKHSLRRSSKFAVESESPQFGKILLRLADEGVELIVVGMAAAILQGVPATTWDLDIVHRRTPENVDRLLRVLQDIQAIARRDPRQLRPDETHLIGPGHVLLETRFGDFDCLGEIDGGRSYEDLLDSAVLVDFENRPLRLLSLREILAVKRRAGRPKDLAMIPYIESTIDEIERKG